MHVDSERRGLFELSSSVMSVGEEGGADGGGGGDAGGDAGEPAAEAGEPATDPAAEDPAAAGAEDPNTDPNAVVAGNEEAPEIQDPAVKAYVDRLLSQQQSQAPQFTPDVFREALAPILQPLIEENRQFRQFFQNGVQQSQAQAQQQRIAATRPRPPDANASPQEHFAWQKADVDWQLNQQAQSAASSIAEIKQMFLSQQQEQVRQTRQAEANAEFERTNAAYAGAIQQLSAMPGFHYFKNPGAAAQLRVIHEAYNRNLPPNQHWSLPQVAAAQLESWGLGPKTPAQNAAGRRIGEKAALDAQRAAVRQPGAKPLPAAAAAKGAKVPNDRRNDVIKAIKNGANLPTELLDFYQIPQDQRRH